MRVREIWTFPDRGQPGARHEAAHVGGAGVAGDRPKRAAVSLVGADSPGARANIVLDAPTGDVEALSGEVVRVGGVLLALEATQNACPGLFAAVGSGGVVAVGNVVEVVVTEGEGPVDAAPAPDVSEMVT